MIAELPWRARVHARNLYMYRNAGMLSSPAVRVLEGHRRLSGEEVEVAGVIGVDAALLLRHASVVL